MEGPISLLLRPMYPDTHCGDLRDQERRKEGVVWLLCTVIHYQLMNGIGLLPQELAYVENERQCVAHHR